MARGQDDPSPKKMRIIMSPNNAAKKYLLIQLQALLDGLNLIHRSSCAAVVAASTLE